MFGTNHKGIGAIIAVVVALAFMLMPVAQVNAQSTGITGAVENIGSAFGGMVEGLTNTLSSDFIMSIVESISMRIGRVFGAGLFVASTDNIFFRVLEWIVAFAILITSQVIWEILDLIYIIPIISIAGVVTQPTLAFLFIYPLFYGMPAIFADNVEGGFNWFTLGASNLPLCLNSIWGGLTYAISIALFLLYAIAISIPLLNCVMSPFTFLAMILIFGILDLVMILFSIFSFLQNVFSSTITDCVIISRAMCRACLGV